MSSGNQSVGTSKFFLSVKALLPVKTTRTKFFSGLNFCRPQLRFSRAHSACNLLKKGPQHRYFPKFYENFTKFLNNAFSYRTPPVVFSCEFYELSKNTFSYRTPPVAASIVHVFFQQKQCFQCLQPYRIFIFHIMLKVKLLRSKLNSEGLKKLTFQQNSINFLPQKTLFYFQLNLSFPKKGFFPKQKYIYCSKKKIIDVNAIFSLALSWQGSLLFRNQLLICREKRQTGFYMIGTSFMKE